ncbi:MAG: caspase, partial [Alphaproteobacteria bacterium]
MLRLVTTLIVAALGFMATFVPAFAEKRVALVLGNSEYRNTAPLKNPINDATDISAALNRLGFTVIYGENLTRQQMEAKIRTFANEIRDADVSLLYYAGHAVQVDGNNYLAPIDATLKSETDLDFEALPLRLIMKQMERSTRISLVFLDACRDNPLARSLKTASRSLKVGSGLAPIERATGMLIAFATEPGSVALDGDGRNSPFTAALLKHIETPDLTVNDIMI